jgi:hypothetical protein
MSIAEVVTNGNLYVSTHPTQGVKKIARLMFKKIFKNISSRPSKTYFYSKFIRDLNTYSDTEIGADIASARFDNAEYFKSKDYIGVDIDGQRLKKGKAKYDSSSSHSPIKADITKPLFKEKTIDIVACTHTLSHINNTKHINVIRYLIGYLNQGGHLFIQFHEEECTSEIESILRDSFEEVNFIQYRNPFSKLFEEFFSDSQGNIDVNSDGIMYVINGFLIIGLAILEYLPLPGREYKYARCFNKLK